MTEAHLLMFMNALPSLIEMRQRETSGEIESKYSISGLIAESMKFYREEILNEGYKSFVHWKKQLSFLEKKKLDENSEAFIKIFEEINNRSKLLNFFIIQLTKDCTAETGLSSGMFTDVKPATFKEILVNAFEKAKESYKVHKTPKVKAKTVHQKNKEKTKRQLAAKEKKELLLQGYSLGNYYDYVDAHPELQTEEFEEYVVCNNKKDRDSGELMDITKKEMLRLGKEFRKTKIFKKSLIHSSFQGCFLGNYSDPDVLEKFQRIASKAFPIKPKTNNLSLQTVESEKLKSLHSSYTAALAGNYPLALYHLSTYPTI